MVACVIKTYDIEKNGELSWQKENISKEKLSPPLLLSAF
jgi:hypothetical protein